MDLSSTVNLHHLKRYTVQKDAYFLLVNNLSLDTNKDIKGRNMTDIIQIGIFLFSIRHARTAI